MTDLEKPKTPLNKKPPTQIAGVTGIDGHGAMGTAPSEPAIDWFKLIDLPAFEMFIAEQSGLIKSPAMNNWVADRRKALSDKTLYDLYATWHKDKGYWPNETPLGCLIQG